ncbi:MAG: hypothetical protein KF678_12760 [Phycisphaeraceae bacterium]|nr:hypothetical protein [Phycisphaeraceae bacterium]
MKHHRGLIAVNLFLLLLLAAVTLAPSSVAQRGGGGVSGGRARGEYTMLSGQMSGSSASAIFVIDSANQDMVALRWNESTKSLDGIGYRDLREDAQASPGR